MEEVTMKFKGQSLDVHAPPAAFHHVHALLSETFGGKKTDGKHSESQTFARARVK